MMEMLKKSGMDPKQIQQMENMMKGLAKKGAKHQAAKLKKEQQTFEAETAGHGTAQVEVEGKRYQLKMTKCEIADRSTGRFNMVARQAPGNENAELEVSGGGGHSGTTMGFSSKKGFYEASSTPTFQLNGKTLEWEGTVQGDKGNVPLKFRLTCRVEMVDYGTPTKPKPKSSVNALTLQLGGETFEFEVGYCSTTEYRTGNLIVEFDATATGTFRGRPAII